MTKALDALLKKFGQITNSVAIAIHPDFIEPETHNKCTPGVSTLNTFISSKFDSIWTTDTVPIIPSFKEKMNEAGKELTIFSISTLIAQTIDNLHNGKSVSNLWNQNK